MINSLIRGLNRIGLAKISLNQESLLTAAIRQTGLKEFGDDHFLLPLQKLLASLETQADLNPSGRFLTRQSIVRLLKHRLYLQQLLQKHPEILQRRIAPPVVIVGLARSGTTRLHRLLANDDQFLHLRTWESANPVPYPESFASREKGQVDPRIRAIEQGVKMVLYMAPQLASAHPLDAHQAEEEIGLLQHAFSSHMFEIQAKVPSFSEWLMQHDQTAAYLDMVTLMKVISWYRNDPEDTPWILKAPQHMQDLDALLNVFPKAKIIFPHRDPIKTVASTCSLIWGTMVRDSDSIDPLWIGEEWLSKTEWMLRKTIKLRESRLSKTQQHDVYYADIHRDWEKSIAEIYRFIGMELNSEIKNNMQHWATQNAQHKHGIHHYQLNDFGLNEQLVDRNLGFYREKFSIPRER